MKRKRPDPRTIDEQQTEELAKASSLPRAGLRPDERDPDELPGEPGSGAGDPFAAGSVGGGSAAGGLGGSNAGDGTPNSAELDPAAGSGIHDNDGDTVEDDGPYSGRAGGAVGGTPAGKRTAGGTLHP